MTVIVHHMLAIVDLAKSGPDATYWLRPGRYLLFKRPQPDGASCGPVYTIGETTLGGSVAWWEGMIAQSPQLVSKV